MTVTNQAYFDEQWAKLMAGAGQAEQALRGRVSQRCTHEQSVLTIVFRKFR